MELHQVLTLAVLACCVSASRAADDPDPQEVLNEARTLAQKGEYEAALEKHLWFHENALRIRPSMVGVRLSFALAYWVSLGEAYPKAREALVGVRDKAAATIREGKGTFSLFHDVASINGYLADDPATAALFKTLQEKQPDVAKRCFGVAEKALVAQRDYGTCVRYIPDPIKRFDQIREGREQMLAIARTQGPQLAAFADKQFAEETGRLIEILVGAGRKGEAQEVQWRALAVLDSPLIRDGVEKAERQQRP